MASRRRRVRWWLKWAGTVACAVIIVSWGVTGFCIWRVSYGVYRAEFNSGSVSFEYWPWPFRDQGFGAVRRPLGFFWGRFDWMWIERDEGTIVTVHLPHWVLLAAVGVPTLLLWLPSRRRRTPGHCQKCGYDLTGNVSGVCPECGRRVGQKAARAAGD